MMRVGIFMHARIVITLIGFPLSALHNDSLMIKEKSKNLNDVPARCAALAHLFKEQKVVKGVLINDTVKRINCTYHEGRLLIDFTRAANRLIHVKNNWVVAGPRAIQDDAMSLECLVTKEQIPCSVEELLQAYTTVIRSIKGDWCKAKADDYSRVTIRPQNPEFWELFTQRSREQRIDTDVLIRSFMANTPFFKNIRCSRIWGTYRCPGRVYIWIQKNFFNDVQNHLGLIIDERKI